MGRSESGEVQAEPRESLCLWILALWESRSGASKQQRLDGRGLSREEGSGSFPSLNPLSSCSRKGSH